VSVVGIQPFFDNETMETLQLEPTLEEQVATILPEFGRRDENPSEGPFFFGLEEWVDEDYSQLS
jgi:hypothetical protein